jgi:NADPH-dependent glutamate synthase beta subunit-like oxidoreductase
VVWGVRDGRDAAEAIDKWIMAAVDSPRTAGVGH